LPSSLRTFLKATACGRGRPRSAACLPAPRLRAALPGGGNVRTRLDGLEHLVVVLVDQDVEDLVRRQVHLAPQAHLAPKAPAA